jgi:hypothetical protein
MPVTTPAVTTSSRCWAPTFRGKRLACSMPSVSRQREHHSRALRSSPSPGRTGTSGTLARSNRTAKHLDAFNYVRRPEEKRPRDHACRLGVRHAEHLRGGPRVRHRPVLVAGAARGQHRTARRPGRRSGPAPSRLGPVACVPDRRIPLDLCRRPTRTGRPGRSPSTRSPCSRTCGSVSR